MRSSLKAVIITRRPLWGLGLQFLLTLSARVRVAEVSHSFTEGQNLITSTEPDLVFVEREVGGFSDGAMERCSRNASPTSIILVIPWNAEKRDEHIGWANEIITDAASPSDVLKAVHRSCPAAKEILKHVLTVREMEVARLIAHGYRTSEIAGALHISENTVKTHRSHISEKLGISGRFSIAHWWQTAWHADENPGGKETSGPVD